jgi:hypothetical protein
MPFIDYVLFFDCVRHIRGIGHERPTLAICDWSHRTVGGKVFLFQLKACHVANFD